MTRTKVISDNLKKWNIFQIELITISSMQYPKKKMLHLNQEIKNISNYYIKKVLMCCDSWPIHKKYVQLNILFQYIVPIQKTKIGKMLAFSSVSSPIKL